MINLYNKDCMEALKEMEDNQFDLSIVDPPYGTKYKTIKNWDFIPSKEYFMELFRTSKNQIIWGGNFFGKYLGATTCPIIWDKENGESFTSDGEFAWCSFNKNQLRIYRQFWFSNMMKKEEKPIIHPTQKPIKLYEWLLMNYAKEGDKILDTHLGSGSIAIACHNLKYDLEGYELDKEYFEAAIKRLEQHQAQKRLF